MYKVFINLIYFMLKLLKFERDLKYKSYSNRVKNYNNNRH